VPNKSSKSYRIVSEMPPRAVNEDIDQAFTDRRHYSSFFVNQTTR